MTHGLSTVTLVVRDDDEAIAFLRFLEAPREEFYGTVVVFEDLYGNRWDLVQTTPL